jgi:hypothetical protein
MIGTVLKEARRARRLRGVDCRRLRPPVRGRYAASRRSGGADREEARLVEFGKEISSNRRCASIAIKWDASGDQGYGGNAYRYAQHLTSEQLTEVVKMRSPAPACPPAIRVHR